MDFRILAFHFVFMNTCSVLEFESNPDILASLDLGWVEINRCRSSLFVTSAASMHDNEPGLKNLLQTFCQFDHINTVKYNMFL
jgi:hypothetical protein